MSGGIVGGLSSVATGSGFWQGFTQGGISAGLSFAANQVANEIVVYAKRSKKTHYYKVYFDEYKGDLKDLPEDLIEGVLEAANSTTTGTGYKVQTGMATTERKYEFGNIYLELDDGSFVHTPLKQADAVNEDGTLGSVHLKSSEVLDLIPASAPTSITNTIRINYGFILPKENKVVGIYINVDR